VKLHRIGATAAAITALLPATAVANTATDIENALRNQGETTYSQPNTKVFSPSVAKDGIQIAGDAGSTTFGIPAKGSPNSENGLLVYNGKSEDSQIAVQTTPDGVRALIHIDSASAPEHYEFPISADVARLEKLEDGSVIALNRQDEVVGLFSPPWAQDKTGRPVPTHYEIEGRTLIQVVNHRGGHFIYGVTADPFWNDAWNTVKAVGNFVWDATVCAAYVTLAVTPAGKVSKGGKVLYKGGRAAYKGVKAMGGVRGVVKVMAKSRTPQEFTERAARKIHKRMGKRGKAKNWQDAGVMAAGIIGVNGVVNNCF
jgi:hypothetical protein